MGLSSGFEFCQRRDEALEGVTKVIKVVDDILVHVPLLEKLEARERAVLATCQAARLTLCLKKSSSVFQAHHLWDSSSARKDTNPTQPSCVPSRSSRSHTI